MKRIMKFAGIIAASAALMVCCSKEASYDDVSTDPSTQQQGDTNPSVVSGEVLDSFGAKFENDVNTNENDVNTKVSISIDEANAKATLVFVKNDQVRVVSRSDTEIYTAKYVYDGEKFVPESTPLTLEENVEVYYPYDEFELDDSNNVVFTMPTAVENLDDLGAKNPLAAQISGDDTKGYTATFKAVGSVLQVNVTGALAISSVKLQNAGSNRMPLGPDATFTIGWSAGKPTMTANESKTNSEMTVSRNVTLSDSPETFYYIVPAGVDYTDVSVLANFFPATIGGLSTFTVSRGNWTADRNKVYTMSFYAGLFSGGTGTSDDPYIIASARDFKNIATYCANGYGVGDDALATTHFLGAYYKQTEHIDFKNVQMAPIGNDTNKFTGTYDGNGKELKNVYIKETGQFAAVFAYVEGSASTASIKDLTVSGTITKTGTTSTSCVGGIAGIISGKATVTGCINNATIESEATYTGGIVGRVYASGNTVTSCVNNGTVASSTSFVGGITGQHVNGGTISNCTNQGAVSGTQYVGGIAGQVRAGSTLDGVHNLTGGDVTGTQYVGGIAGCVGAGAGHDNGGNTTKVINARVDGANVTATTTGNVCQVGGIIGVVWPSAHIQGCIAVNGTVKGYKTVGGAIGQVDYAVASSKSTAKNRILVAECLAGMNVENNGDNTDARIGGFLGHYLTSSAGRNEYVFVYQNGVIGGSITAKNCDYVGTFVGRVAAKGNCTRVYDSYSLLEDSDYNVTTTNAHLGGFVCETSTASYNNCYFCVSENDPGSITGITKISKTDIRSQTLANNTPTTYETLTLGGWQNPVDVGYPVPGSLVTFGYYK